MKTLLIVAHCPSDNTKRLVHAMDSAIQTAIQSLLIEGVTVVVKSPLQATAADVLQADAILIGTTENFGYMAGLTKDFFERIFYPVLDLKQGLPVACYIRAGLDGTGTQCAIESIITGLRWRWVQQPLVLKGEWKDGFETQVNELVLTVAAGLSIGSL